MKPHFVCIALLVTLGQASARELRPHHGASGLSIGRGSAAYTWPQSGATGSSGSVPSVLNGHESSIEFSMAARRLLAPADSGAGLSGPAQPVEPVTLPPAPPPPRKTSFGGSPLNNNIAFVGVALALGLVVSCCWCGCGVYRRRFANSGQLRYSMSGTGILRVVDFGGEQPQYGDLKMTVQPVMVLQPDASLAYTFRELDTEDKADPTPGEPAMEQLPAGSEHPGSGGVSGEGAGEAASPAISPAVASGSNSSGEQQQRPRSLCRPRPSDPMISLSDLSGRAGSSREPATNGSAEHQPAVNTLRQAGVLGQPPIQHIGVPVMLEWDLSAAVEDLDLQDTEATKLMLGRAASAKRLPRESSSRMQRVASQGLLARLGSGTIGGEASFSRSNDSFRATSGRSARGLSGSTLGAQRQDPLPSAAPPAAAAAASSGSPGMAAGGSGPRADSDHDNTASLELQPRSGSFKHT